MKLRKNFMTMSADEYDTSSETYIACNKQINNWYISELGGEPLELGDKQLDLGCGPGAVLLNNYRMLGNHMQITGIDVNEKYLASSREKFKKFKPRHMTTAFVNYDAGKYNDKDEIFPRQFCGTSLITSSCMLHWIQDDRTVLRFCHRSLKKDGHILFLMATERYPLFWCMAYEFLAKTDKWKILTGRLTCWDNNPGCPDPGKMWMTTANC